MIVLAWKQRFIGVAVGVVVTALVWRGVGYFGVFLGPFVGLIALVLGFNLVRPWLTWTGVTTFALAIGVIGYWLLWLWWNSLAHSTP